MIRYFVSLFVLLNNGAQAADAISLVLQKDVCAYVATNDLNRASYSINAGWIDVNNNGVDEKVAFEISGTSSTFDNVITSSSKDAPQIIVQADAAEDYRWKGWGAKDQRWMCYEGHTFLVSYYDLYHLYKRISFPRYIWYVAPDYKAIKLCDLQTNRKIKNRSGWHKAFAQVPDADEICQKSAFGEIQTYAYFIESDHQKLGVEMSSNAYARLDINNDGKKKSS